MASLLAINYYLLCSIRYSAETSQVLLFVESVNGQFTCYKLVMGIGRIFIIDHRFNVNELSSIIIG